MEAEDGSGVLHYPLEDVAHVGGTRARAQRHEVALGVFDGTCEDVDRIVQFVDLGSGQHQLGLGELDVTGASAGDPVPLLARPRAIPSRTAGRLARWEG